MASAKMFLLFLFLQVVKPVAVDTKQIVLVDTEDVVAELETQNSFGWREGTTFDSSVSMAIVEARKIKQNNKARE